MPNRSVSHGESVSSLPVALGGSVSEDIFPLGQPGMDDGLGFDAQLVSIHLLPDYVVGVQSGDYIEEFGLIVALQGLIVS